MNVVQLLHELRMVAHIEIVISLLPEMGSIANKPARDALFQRLDRI
jgi:hypothetical protein